MRIVAWILLILGIGLAGLGGARNGTVMTEIQGSTLAHDMLAGDLATLDGAYAAHSAAMDALRAARASGDAEAVTAAEEAVTAAEQAIHGAQATIESRRTAGTYGGNLAAERVRLAAAVPETPGPGDRLLGWLQTGGLFWGPGVVLVATGAFLARSAARKASRDPVDAAGRVDFAASVQEIRDALDAVAETIAELPMDAPSVEVREEIDRIQDTVITPVVDGRDQLMARHGTTGFAVYFGSFSAGERNLARTWSALTDGHSVVAREALDRSRESFAAAAREWDEAEKGM